MAQDITIAGASYEDVPAIRVPKTTSGEALFVDASDTTATASDVLTGKSFHAANGTLTQGAMPLGSAETPLTTIRVQPGLSITPDGKMWAVGSTTTYITPTVVPGYISSGTSGKIVASCTVSEQLTTKAATTYTPTTTDQTIAAETYLLGTQTISGDANLVPSNIANGVSIFGVTGTYSGAPLEEKDANFYDYDGTLLYSYTASEFSQLSSMPGGPNHSTDGLTFQEWNWTLADAKSYINECGRLVIGATYVPTDNNTHIYAYLDDAQNYCLQVSIGTNTTINVVTPSETFSNITGEANSTVTVGPFGGYGDSEIIIEVISGSIKLFNDNNQTILKYENTGSGVTANQGAINTIKRIQCGIDISSVLFEYCYNLESVTIPDNGSISLGAYCFYNCFNLRAVILPKGVTNMYEYTFYATFQMKCISLPNTVTKIGQYSFENCSVSRICLPASLGIGTDSVNKYVFYNSRIKYLYMPYGSFTMFRDNSFQVCSLLVSINPESETSLVPTSIRPRFPNSLTTLGKQVFASCFSFSEAYITSYISSIGNNAFFSSGIRYFRFANLSGSSLTAIPNYCCSNCGALEYVDIAESVTDIGNYAFRNCYALVNIWFYPTTPPTLGGSAVFDNLPTNCIIHVPYDSYNDYISATNYPDPEMYTYEAITV